MTTPTTDARPTTLRYLPGLDGLRGISVLAVVVFHHYLVGGHEAGWAPGGFLGVEVFFCVSGYLITSLLLSERRDTGRVSLGTFYIRRARRLLPALFVLLAVVVAYSLLFLPDAIGALRSDVVAALTYTSNWWQIIAGRSYFVEAGRPELLKHLWSLAIEEQYYLAWPFVLMFGLRRLGRQRMFGAIVGVAVASTIALGFFAYGSIDFAYYSTFTRLSGLLLGSAFAFSFAPYRIRGVPGPGARLALDAVGVVGMLVLVASFGMLQRFGINGFSFPTSIHDNLAVFRGGFLLVDIATIMVIAAAVHPASDVGRALGWRPLQWIGLRSYSLYLWHYPIFCVTRPALDIDRLGIWFLGIDFAGWPVFVLRLLLSFGAAELSFRFIETPIRRGAIGRYREVLRGSVGAYRQRLIRRGAVIGSTGLVLAFILGTGLATAQPQAPNIPGVNEADSQDGAHIDQRALRALQSSTTSTTSTTVRASPTTRPTTVTTVKGSKPTTSTTKPKTLPPQVLGIGDSVMQGAATSLRATIPGMAVDAARSRQFAQALDVVRSYQSYGALPGAVVIHLGTNGRITNPLFDEIMQTVGPGHNVYFLTARVPRLWESAVNSTLHQGATRWKNAHVLEWRDYAGCHDDWFVNDGFHLRTLGQRAYGEFVRDGLLGKAPTTCKK